MYKISTIVCVSALLTGCAGMNTEFEHNQPAKDSGYWLQQADEMTGNGSTGSPDGKMDNVIGGSSLVNMRDYKLINTGNLRLPVKVFNAYAPTTFNHENKVATNDDITVTFGNGGNTYDNSVCSMRFCYPEPANPLRESDQIARMWLAPYVSPDNNVHLGEIVYFITKSSQWAGVEEGKK